LKKIELDARDLEHPVPLQLALNHLQQMRESEFLYMVHRKNPIPLLEVAKVKNYSYLSKEIDGVWHILISKNRDINLEELLDV
jgi:TusA-related sulfurtransferase